MSKKNKKSVEYHVNDLVFARVRGYPPWPARIVETGLKYKVIFYGTGEIGNIKIEDIFNYEDNREAFKKKFAKRKNYQESLNEITIAWNRKRDLEIPVAKDKSFSENKENDNSLGATNVIAKPIEDKAETDDDVASEKEEEASLSDAKEEPKPGTSQKNNTKRPLSESDSAASPLIKRFKPTKDDVTLGDSYLENTTLKFEREGVLYTMYTVAELKRIKDKHDEILSLKKNESVNLDKCDFIDDYSVALVFEPLIHPVVFGLHITKHMPDVFDDALMRLEWESTMIRDVHHIILDLRNNCKNIQEVVDDYFLDLTDFEELIGTMKIIYEKEKLSEFQFAAIKQEILILKIVLTIREYVPIEIKDESYLTKAYELLRLIREKYMPSYISVMKHPVIVECFFKLSKYSCKQKLMNEEIVEKIRQEATSLTNDIRDEIQKYMVEDDFSKSFWRTYLSCLKRFRSAIPSVCRYDFVALASREEYLKKLEEEKSISQHSSSESQSISLDDEYLRKSLEETSFSETCSSDSESVNCLDDEYLRKSLEEKSLSVCSLSESESINCLDDENFRKSQEKKPIPRRHSSSSLSVICLDDEFLRNSLADKSILRHRSSASLSVICLDDEILRKSHEEKSIRQSSTESQSVICVDDEEVISIDD